jgi:hypothetical protein
MPAQASYEAGISSRGRVRRMTHAMS